MPFVWMGALLIVLKGLDVGPFGQWSWWWILLPLALAFAWFELIEPLFGLDRRKRQRMGGLEHRAEVVRDSIRGFVGAGGASIRRGRVGTARGCRAAHHRAM